MKNTLGHIKNVITKAIFKFNGENIDIETVGNLEISHRGDSMIVIMGDKGQTLIELDLSTLLDKNDNIKCDLGTLGTIYVKKNHDQK